MRAILAARCVACCVFMFVCLGRVADAQRWNDSVTLALVDRAVARRVLQMADTGLADYRATAHGYVTFLAQLGERFPTPPKIVKSDELEVEVYWQAPNRSKQRIIGRRDTLLLPTDIAYHRDHLAIVQNNFGPLIRIGDGDEVRDTPHPLSPIGRPMYDFALTDSFSIGAGAQRIRVYELKVRPKDDRQPRVVGALYVDRANADVARMNVSFTRAALLDKALEDLSVVLENRLVGGRFWLPSRQEIEIRRNGEFLDYPVRGIIRGRWEIGDYRFNLNLSPTVFAGPEIVQAPAAELRQYKWTGKILDSLPPDVRAVTDADVQRVQAEARELVRARALDRASGARLSAGTVSDFAHFNRVEGLALGAGVAKFLGNGVSVNARARYGIDDAQGKGTASASKTYASGLAFRVFGSFDLRNAGDVQERSTVVNSVAAQEFGSDYTDPYLVRAAGANIDLTPFDGWHSRLTGSYEWQSPTAVRATPVVGHFFETLAVPDQHATRVSVEVDRPQSLWLAGTELTVRAEARARFAYTRPQTFSTWAANAFRGAIAFNIERPFGAHRLATTTTLAGVATSAGGEGDLAPPQELVFYGGPISAPGFDYHALSGRGGFTEHLEWRTPVPFPSFSLGRFGRIPAQAALAPFVHVAAISGYDGTACIRLGSGGSGQLGSPPRLDCTGPGSGLYPSVGAAFLLPFDLLRLQVARGLGRNGRWAFNVDLSREFWPIL